MPKEGSVTTYMLQAGSRLVVCLDLFGTRAMQEALQLGSHYTGQDFPPC